MRQDNADVTKSRQYAAHPALAVNLKMTENEEFVVRFVNQSDKPIRILKPLDGSYYSWIMPHYTLSLDDEKGTTFDQFPRCGNFGYPYSDTTWPDDYLVDIGPGKTYEEATYLPFVIPEDGDYTVTFNDVFTPDTELLLSLQPFEDKEERATLGMALLQMVEGQAGATPAQLAARLPGVAWSGGRLEMGLHFVIQPRSTRKASASARVVA